MLPEVNINNARSFVDEVLPLSCCLFTNISATTFSPEAWIEERLSIVYGLIKSCPENWFSKAALVIQIGEFKRL